MDFLRALITAPVSIAVLFLLSKFIGNKQMSSLNLFDYINGITIGSIAAEMATAEMSDFWACLVALIVYVKLLGFVRGFRKNQQCYEDFNRQVYCDFRQRKVVQKEFFGCKN